MEALQEIRINHRWKAIDQENSLLAETKEKKIATVIEVFENCYTRKQLLARSRYLLYKSKDKWTSSQKQIAEILFTEYLGIENAYYQNFLFNPKVLILIHKN